MSQWQPQESPPGHLFACVAGPELTYGVSGDRDPVDCFVEQIRLHEALRSKNVTGMSCTINVTTPCREGIGLAKLHSKRAELLVCDTLDEGPEQLLGYSISTLQRYN